MLLNSNYFIGDGKILKSRQENIFFLKKYSLEKVSPQNSSPPKAKGEVGILKKLKALRLLLALSLVISLILTGCTFQNILAGEPASQLSPKEMASALIPSAWEDVELLREAPFYEVALKMDPEKHQLRGDMVLHYLNFSGKPIEHMDLVVYGNDPQFKKGGGDPAEILELKVNGSPAEFTLSLPLTVYSCG